MNGSGIIIDKNYRFDTGDPQIMISSNLRRIRLNPDLSIDMGLDKGCSIEFYVLGDRIYMYKSKNGNGFNLTCDSRKNKERPSYTINSTKLVTHIVKTIKYEKLVGKNIHLKVKKSQGELQGATLFQIDF